MSWFYRHTKRSSDEGTVQILTKNLITITKASLGLTLGNLTVDAGDIDASAGSVSDANGDLARRYFVQSAEIDIQAPTATTTLVVVPEAATILKASYIITQAVDTNTAGAGIQLGIADADGSGNADVDAFVLGITDADNGEIAGVIPLNAVQNLTLVLSALGAGKALTATSIQDTGTGSTGKLKLFVEYLM